jgi:glucose/galactose transporter
MMIGLVIMAIGAIIFIPAALTRNYAAFLAGLFTQAAGLTILQTAANPYVTILGPLESAATRISVMGVCNKVAGAIAPLLLINAITSHPSEIDDLQKSLPLLSANQANVILTDLTRRLILPYGMMAAALLLLALFIYFSGLPDIKEEASVKKAGSLLQFPHLINGAIAIFCSVSVEVLVIDSIVSYAQHMGEPFSSAKYFATYTLVLMIVSYLLAIFTIPKYFSQRHVLIACSVFGIVMTLLVSAIDGISSVTCLALLGFGNALLWPSIWPLSLNGLGAYTKKGTALMIMGIIGGAVTPLLYGYLGKLADPQKAYLVMVPCYAFLLYFASVGYRAGRNKPLLKAVTI